jgi:hypothetical protein
MRPDQLDLRLQPDRALISELERRGWTCERHKPRDDNARPPDPFFLGHAPAQRARHDHPEPFSGQLGGRWDG